MKGWGIMLNDLIVINRSHCETAEALVVSYPNAEAYITRLASLCRMVRY